MKILAVAQHAHSYIKKMFLSCWVENELVEGKTDQKRINDKVLQ